MKKTYHRPSRTTRWQISTPLIIPTSKDDVRVYATVTPKRATIVRTRSAGKQAIVIVGCKEDPVIVVNPNDVVFTCVFGSSGHLSTLPEEFVGKEVTIIYKQ